MKVISTADNPKRNFICSARRNKMKSTVRVLSQFSNEDPLIGLREPYSSLLHELLQNPQARDEFIRQLKMYDAHGQLLSHYKGTTRVAP